MGVRLSRKGTHTRASQHPLTFRKSVQQALADQKGSFPALKAAIQELETCNSDDERAWKRGCWGTPASAWAKYTLPQAPMRMCGTDQAHFEGGTQQWLCATRASNKNSPETLCAWSLAP